MTPQITIATTATHHMIARITRIAARDFALILQQRFVARTGSAVVEPMHVMLPSNVAGQAALILLPMNAAIMRMMVQNLVVL